MQPASSASAASPIASTLKATAAATGSSQVQGMDLESLIIKIDCDLHPKSGSHSIETKATQGDVRSTQQTPNPHIEELNRRVQGAKLEASKGNLKAITTLVTIAAAADLVGAPGVEAKKILNSLTAGRSGSQGGPGPVSASVVDAVASLARGYGRVMSESTASWARGVLSTAPAAQRHVQVLGDIESYLNFEKARREPIPIPVKDGKHSLMPGREFGDEELLPALNRLQGENFQLKGVTFGGGALPVTLPSEAHDLGAVGPLSVVQQGGVGANAKPVVTLSQAQGHWVALIAMPPRSGAPDEKPELIIFDSNSKLRAAKGEKPVPNSQLVGRNLADQLRSAGYPVKTAFGFIQEGMAANACGPLCFAAIEHAFDSRASETEPLTSEVVAGRLMGFIEQFGKKLDQRQRDAVVASAQTRILEAAALQREAPQPTPASAASAATLAPAQVTRQTAAPELGLAEPKLPSLDEAEKLMHSARQGLEAVQTRRSEIVKLRAQAKRELAKLQFAEGNVVVRFLKEVNGTFAVPEDQVKQRQAEVNRLEREILQFDRQGPILEKVEVAARARLGAATQVKIQADILSKPLGAYRSGDVSNRDDWAKVQRENLAIRMRTWEQREAEFQRLQASVNSPTIAASSINSGSSSVRSASPTAADFSTPRRAVADPDDSDDD